MDNLFSGDMPMHWDMVIDDSDVVYRDVRNFAHQFSPPQELQPAAANVITVDQVLENDTKPAEVTPIVLSPFATKYDNRRLKAMEQESNGFDELEPKESEEQHMHHARKNRLIRRAFSSSSAELYLEAEVELKLTASDDDDPLLSPIRKVKFRNEPLPCFTDSESNDEPPNTFVKPKCCFCNAFFLNPRNVNRHIIKNCAAAREFRENGGNVDEFLKKSEKDFTEVVVSCNSHAVPVCSPVRRPVTPNSGEDVYEHDGVLYTRRVTRAMAKTDPVTVMTEKRSEFKCEICDKTFTQKRFLGTHQRTHKPETKCKGCHKVFKQLSRHKCKA